MKTILVPTDLSPTALLGFELAIEIAKRCNASIRLVNFTKHPLGKTFNTTGKVNVTELEEEQVFTLELLRHIKEEMEGLAVQYGTAQGVNVETQVIDARFSSGLDACLSQENIDLIVMGTSGEETPREAFTGNHTARAIKLSDCPVLSVRDGFSIDDFKTIVIGVAVITDNQLAEGLSALRELSDCFEAHVHLVHVRDRSKDSNLILHEYFSKMATIAGIKKFTVAILDDDDSVDAIIRYADEVNAGFVAVVNKPHESIFRIFSKRITKRIIKEEGRPVVTLNIEGSQA